MKLKVFLIVILILAAVAGLYMAAGPDFLPWMRYRYIADWSHGNVYYEVELVNDRDSTCRVFYRFSSISRRTMISWSGDSLGEVSNSDGFGLPVKTGDISGFDSSIISITGNRVNPLRVGRTLMLVKLPNRIDTLGVNVKSEEGCLAVSSGH
jgi:hypothetical protein